MKMQTINNNRFTTNSDTKILFEAAGRFRIFKDAKGITFEDSKKKDSYYINKNNVIAYMAVIQLFVDRLIPEPVLNESLEKIWEIDI